MMTSTPSSLFKMLDELFRRPGKHSTVRDDYDADHPVLQSRTPGLRSGSGFPFQQTVSPSASNMRYADVETGASHNLIISSSIFRRVIEHPCISRDVM